MELFNTAVCICSRETRRQLKKANWMFSLFKSPILKTLPSIDSNILCLFSYTLTALSNVWMSCSLWTSAWWRITLVWNIKDLMANQGIPLATSHIKGNLNHLKLCRFCLALGHLAVKLIQLPALHVVLFCRLLTHILMGDQLRFQKRNQRGNTILARYNLKIFFFKGCG